jgi:hypothetical protein
MAHYSRRGFANAAGVKKGGSSKSTAARDRLIAVEVDRELARRPGNKPTQICDLVTKRMGLERSAGRKAYARGRALIKSDVASVETHS